MRKSALIGSLFTLLLLQQLDLAADRSMTLYDRNERTLERQDWQQGNGYPEGTYEYPQGENDYQPQDQGPNQGYQNYDETGYHIQHQNFNQNPAGRNQGYESEGLESTTQPRYQEYYPSQPNEGRYPQYSR